MSFSKTIRSLHRDLGYFVIGLTLIYAITGIILSGRALGWLEKEYISKTQVSKNLDIKQFNNYFIEKVIKEEKVPEVFDKESYTMAKKYLKLKLEKEEENTYFFKAWKNLKVKYNFKNGMLVVQNKGYPAYIEIFIDAHKATHKKIWFYLAIIYSVILSFLAISSFWMLKGKNGFKQRGIYFMLAGFLTIAVFIYI